MMRKLKSNGRKITQFLQRRWKFYKWKLCFSKIFPKLHKVKRSLVFRFCLLFVTVAMSLLMMTPKLRKTNSNHSCEEDPIDLSTSAEALLYLANSKMVSMRLWMYHILAFLKNFPSSVVIPEINFYSFSQFKVKISNSCVQY